jgi:hypothetical protein
MKLYVKSISTGAIERSPGFFFHSCDLRKVESITFYSEEDKEAIEFLKEKNIPFSLVDLSKCPFAVRLKAKFAGINNTPTLIFDDGKKLKGVQKIKAHFEGDVRGANLCHT